MKATSTRLAFVSVLAAAAATLTACAAPPTVAATGAASATTASFVPCIVSDSGGFNDSSFNASALSGITKASTELGVTFKKVESKSDDDFAPNVAAQVSEGCDFIVTVGFSLSDVTVAAAKANPDVKFAIVDDGLDKDSDGKPDVANGKPILFNTAEASFLAGYAAAAYSKTGVVGTFGGKQIPPVTLFMDGFADGVAYFDKANNAKVEVVGWDKAKQIGTFTGGFAAGVEAKTAAQGLLDQNADVILPVGGPIYQSAAQAIRDKGGDLALIGVDADMFNSDPSVADLLLTSVMKGVDAGVHDVVVAAAKGDFSNEPYVGTLANGGIGIAPFHNFESKVPATLASELEQVKAKIISGEIAVTSQSTPK